ncbi:hypothetical protein [Alkalihalobacillus sp. TS-13]|uniref:hypothetical protein n=1 Tax=Alkalihalobacillus sp. TS-13 TaxID=2842455 RepID=UPI001C87CC60|nr:hypothetical protein [Alkalihalobacillus sp. TS-13]
MYYWSLVESYRSEGKVKQRVIQSLGNTQTALILLKGKTKYGRYYQQIQQFVFETYGRHYQTNNIYFVYTGSLAETEAIKRVKPERLLLSYFYFRHQSISEVVNKLGYTPCIMLDSGAFSAYTRGNNLSPLDYMHYIQENQHYIDHYISLDVIGDSELTFLYYEIIRSKGYHPLPVFHYGDNVNVLKRYVEMGSAYIALGGTVPERDKRKVAQWVIRLQTKYPDVRFHLLGTSSVKVIETTNVYSCDSSTWILQAANGKPRQIKGRSRQAKIERAIYNIRAILQHIDS